MDGISCAAFQYGEWKALGEEQLQEYLLYILEKNEVKYGIQSSIKAPNLRLSNLIETAYEKTGKQVVVLIDEYDAPLLDVVHDDEKLEGLRYIMRNFYSPLKDCEPYLRFVFLTGITKFSQLSIFSELNNISNVSMDDEYAGYHFTGQSPDIFNPFSLLNAMDRGKLDYYWFTSGSPTYLINMMRKFGVVYTDFAEGMEADASDFDAPTETMTTLTPLLYQSGYITIKDYDKKYGSYTLGIPNREVRIGLTKALIPYYVTPNTLATNNTVRNMARALDKEDLDLALQHLQTFLGTIPYCDNTNYEGHYQQMLFVIFTLLSAYMVDVEVRTPRGRVVMISLLVIIFSHSAKNG